MGATGLYHIRRKLYSSAWSLGSSNFVSPRNAAAAADARNNRRFIARPFTLFYLARGCQPFVQSALFGGLIGLAETIVHAREVIMNIRLVRIDGDAALQFLSRIGILALLFQQDAQFVMALPLIALERDGNPQQPLGLNRVTAALDQTLRVYKLRSWIIGIFGRPVLESSQHLRHSIASLIQHLS